MNCLAISVECFVQHLGCFFKFVLLLAKRVVLFIRGLAAGHSMQSVFVVPVDPFHGFRFELDCGFPRAEMFDALRLEQSDDGFGQGVVEAAIDASSQTVASGSAYLPPSACIGSSRFPVGLRGNLGTFQKHFLTDSSL